MNRYAKPVKKSEIIALDEDDTIAIITRELVEKHPLFSDVLLFTVGVKPDIHLDSKFVFNLIQEGFEKCGILLSKSTRTRMKKKDSIWSVIDYERQQTYTVRKEKNELKIYYQRISTAKTKAIYPKDGNNITSIITLYDVLETVLRHKDKKWNDFKKIRPDPSIVLNLYDHAVMFWNTMIEYFPPLKEFKETSPGKSVARQYRNSMGGNLLFRPVGLEIVAAVIREATNQWLCEKTAIKMVSKIPLELASEPWAGLLWDKTNKRMVTAPANKKVAKQLLLYLIGGDLKIMNTEYDNVRKEYAGLLNKKESEIEFNQPLS